MIGPPPPFHGSGQLERGAAEILLPPASLRGSTAIATRLRRAIVDGVYTYGEKLPPERELARSLGASRATVRNALEVLEQADFIRRRPGSGTFVAHGKDLTESGYDVADTTSPLELMDVREAIEPRIVRLAVLHSTPRDLEALGDALKQLESAGTDRDQFTQYDRTFHMALANATHNPLMIFIYRHVNEVRGHGQWSKVKDKVLTPACMAEYNRQHRALLEAVEARDSSVAFEIIVTHLAKARRDLIGAQSD